VKARHLLKAALTIALLLLILRSVDLHGIRGHLGHLNPLLIPVLLAAYWVAQLACTQRWRLFARMLGIEGSYASFVRVYFAAMFYSIGVTTAGGDAIRAYGAANRGGASFKRGIASVVPDRVSGMIALLLVGSAGVAIRPVFWKVFPCWLFYALAWAGFAVLALFFRYIRVKPLVEARQAVSEARITARDLAAANAMSFVNAAIILAIVWSLFADTGHPVGILTVCALVPVIESLAMLPVTISGLGIREWGYIQLFGAVGVPDTLALSVSLAFSALIIVRNLAGALFLARIPASWRTPK
jgi:uncharacterized membrane protein YbhN (UPF0104 family)